MSLPIEYVTASGTSDTTNGTFTSNTLTWTQPTSVTGNNIAVVGYLLVTQGSTATLASASGSGTYGGSSMSATKVVFGVGGDNCGLIVYRLANAPTGSQTVSMTISGMSQTGLVGKQYTAGVAVYRNVYSTSYEGSNGASSTSTVTTRTQSFSGVQPRDVCVGIHGRTDTTAFSSYNRNQRLTTTQGSYCRGLIGDTIALQLSGTVTSTATNAADNTIAAGVNLIRDPESGFFQMF